MTAENLFGMLSTHRIVFALCLYGMCILFRKLSAFRGLGDATFSQQKKYGKSSSNPAQNSASTRAQLL